MKEKLKKWLWRVTGTQAEIDRAVRELKKSEERRKLLLEELEKCEYKEGKHCVLCENAYRIEAAYVGGVVVGGVGCKKKINCESFKEKKS